MVELQGETLDTASEHIQMSESNVSVSEKKRGKFFGRRQKVTEAKKEISKPPEAKKDKSAPADSKPKAKPQPSKPAPSKYPAVGGKKARDLAAGSGRRAPE